MRIKKMYQGTVPENKILDTYSTSATDTYSCNYINNIVQDVYSTDEQIIGKDTDGKAIYKKTFLGTIPDATILMSNVKTLTKVYGDANINGQRRPMMYYEQFNNLQYFLQVRVQNNNVVLACVTAGQSFTPTECNITLEYTKTTDV